MTCNALLMSPPVLTYMEFLLLKSRVSARNVLAEFQPERRVFQAVLSKLAGTIFSLRQTLIISGGCSNFTSDIENEPDDGSSRIHPLEPKILPADMQQRAEEVAGCATLVLVNISCEPMVRQLGPKTLLQVKRPTCGVQAWYPATVAACLKCTRSTGDKSGGRHACVVVNRRALGLANRTDSVTESSSRQPAAAGTALEERIHGKRTPVSRLTCGEPAM